MMLNASHLLYLSVVQVVHGNNAFHSAYLKNCFCLKITKLFDTLGVVSKITVYFILIFYLFLIFELELGTIYFIWLKDHSWETSYSGVAYVIRCVCLVIVAKAGKMTGIILTSVKTMYDQLT